MDLCDFLKSYVDWQLVSQLVFNILVLITFRFVCYEKKFERNLQVPNSYMHGC